MKDEQIDAMLCCWASAKYNLQDVGGVSFHDGRYGPYVAVWTANSQPHRFDELDYGDLIRDILNFAITVKA